MSMAAESASLLKLSSVLSLLLFSCNIAGSGAGAPSAADQPGSQDVGDFPEENWSTEDQGLRSGTKNDLYRPL